MFYDRFVFFYGYVTSLFARSEVMTFKLKDFGYIHIQLSSWLNKPIYVGNEIDDSAIEDVN